MTPPKVIICGLVFFKHEKEPYVKSGKSLQGAQEYDSEAETLRCHECGKWFRNLSNHIVRFHGLGKDEYRVRHGISSGSKLIAPRLSKKLSDNVSPVMKENTKRRFDSGNAPTRASWTPEARAKRHATLIAKRNLVSRCPAQLAARICSIAEDLGRTPTFKELSDRGIGNVRRAAIQAGLTTSELMTAIGLKPNRWGGHTERKYSEAMLVELLRDFYVLNRRTPTRADWRTGILPSASVFGSYFGSLPAAYEAAGLTKVARGENAA